MTHALYTLAALYRSDPAKALEIAEREGRESDERIEARAALVRSSKK